MILLFILKVLAGPFLLLIYKPKISGKKNMKYSGKMIIMSNHRSFNDPILLELVFFSKRIRFIAKKELFDKGWLASWFLKALGAFPVGRGEHDTKAVRYSVEILRKGGTFGIFPEGTRTKNGELLPFHAGVSVIAARTHSRILPVYIGGQYGLFKRIKLAVGEPIDLSEHYAGTKPTSEEINAITQMLRDRIAELGETVKP